MGNQCCKAAKKGNKILGMIARTFVSRSKKVMLRLYKSLVRPNLEYCIQAWRPHLVTDIEVLEKVQRRATRMMVGSRDMTYERRLKFVGFNYVGDQKREGGFIRSVQNTEWVGRGE